MNEPHDTIRPLTSPEDYDACIALQEETWGRGFSELVPPSLLHVGQFLGGVTAGAFSEDGTLDAFVFGLTGVRDGELVHWSTQLAVRGSIRDEGLGTRLKRYQRRVLLERGVRKMYWTLDPLQARNAHVSFSKLGIVVREYLRDMYPRSKSPLHRGIGTDRFLALWLLDSARVEARVERGEADPGSKAGDGVPAALEASGGGGLAEPREPRLDLDAPRVTVAIPTDISVIMDASIELAVAWRHATRAALTHYLERGYEVQEALRGEPVSRYLLVRS